MHVGPRLRLKPGEVSYPDGYLLKMFALHDTRCETPECSELLPPATDFYHSEWSLCWVCSACAALYRSGGGVEKLIRDRSLAKYMYHCQMLRSYRYVNELSGLALDEAINLRETALKQLERDKGKEEAAIRRDLRKQINAGLTKVGAPDDEIRSAPHRQFDRQQLGKPIAPRKKNDRELALRAQLIVPSAKLKRTQ